MFRARQAILMTIAAAMLTATVSACEGSPKQGTSASAATAGNPLKGLTSYQIIQRAFVNTEASVNVHVAGQVTNSGKSTYISDLALVNGGGNGCVGDLYQPGAGTFQLIYDGTTAWILPNPKYWQTMGASYVAAQPRIEGKYLQQIPGGPGLGSLTSLCSLSTLVGSGPGPARRTGFGQATPTTVGTLPCLKITDIADGGYAIVSDTALPRLVAIVVPGQRNGRNFTLHYTATQVTVAAPVTKEVVDEGTRYGL